jgi:hypothetical protein
LPRPGFPTKIVVKVSQFFQEGEFGFLDTPSSPVSGSALVFLVNQMGQISFKRPVGLGRLSGQRLILLPNRRQMQVGQLMV